STSNRAILYSSIGKRNLITVARPNTMKAKGFKIVSGGQTGADRAALDWAIARGIPHGGWCPKGRRAEDGIIAPSYKLHKTPSIHYVERTEWNVRDSDGTIIFTVRTTLSGGSLKTAEFARKYGRPWLHVHRGQPVEAPELSLRQF